MKEEIKQERRKARKKIIKNGFDIRVIPPYAVGDYIIYRQDECGSSTPIFLDDDGLIKFAKNLTN